MFKIMTDTMADLPAGFLKNENIDVLFMPYQIEGREYSTIVQMDPQAFYNKMREGFVPSTSPITFDAARTAFGQALKESNQILYFCFSSKLSDSYQNVLKAAQEINQGVEEAKIIVIDTKAGSAGEGLMVYKAADMRKAGASMQEVADYIEAHKMNFVQLLTVDEMIYLYRGNRIKKSSLVLSTLIGVHPILHIDEEGAFTVFEKVRGRKNSLLAMVDYMEENMTMNRDDNELIAITHCGCEDEAEIVAEEIRRRFGLERIIVGPMSPAVGAHTGPGTIGLFFRGTKR